MKALYEFMDANVTKKYLYFTIGAKQPLFECDQYLALPQSVRA